MSDIAKIWEQQHQASQWMRQTEIDSRLQRGIDAGEPFGLFQQKTGCPQHLQGRYEELQKLKAAEEKRQRDPFLEGFQRG